MQLESHATPQRETPQQRYANLHRAIERGLESDEVWKDLADACLSLGHNDEAVRCLGRMRSEAARLALESRLIRLGLVSAGAARAAARSAEPSLANLGKPTRTENSLGAHRLRDHVLDAVQYLFHQHMPWLVILTTLAFPLVVGAGGFLTAGGSLLLLAAIAAVPGVCVLGIVGAMGRQILLTSADGTSDVPAIPSFGQLVADARRFLLDLGLVLGVLLGPAFIALALNAPAGTTLPGLVVGAYFVPMAWVMRQLRGDWAALSPVMLLRAIARGGWAYSGLAIVTGALFAPAALVTWGVFGRPIWVQIAIVGPLCVLPIYVASRLLGTWLDVNRASLTGLMLRDRKPGAGAPAAPVRATAPASGRVRQPRRPDALREFRAPVAKRPGAGTRPGTAVRKAPPAPVSAHPRPPAAAAKPPAPAQPRPATPAPAKPQPKQPAPPAKPPARAIQGRVPARLTDEPDLASMPGAVVVSGDERSRHGAASKRP